MILMTGVTGKSGKWLIRYLEDDEELCRSTSFRTIVRSTSNTKPLDESSLSIERVIGDINDDDVLCRAMKNVDTVIHIAGIHTSEKVVNAAAKCGVGWLILVHTTGIYSKYKMAGQEYRNIEERIETFARDHHIALTILRPTMIYGSVEDQNIAVFVKMIDKLKFFPVVDHARHSLQPVHEKDLGRAYYLVLKNGTTRGKHYILSGKEPIRLMDIFKCIAENLNRQPIFVSVPFPIAYGGAWTLFIISFKKVDIREKVQRLVEPRIFPHEEASKDFGFSPMKFEEGVRSEIEEYKALSARTQDDNRGEGRAERGR